MMKACDFTRLPAALACLALLILSIAPAHAADSRDTPAVDRVSGPPPGTVVFASPNSEKFFCGSPSIVVRGDGTYLVSHDIGGQHDRAGHTLVHVSMDRGATWRPIADLPD